MKEFVTKNHTIQKWFNLFLWQRNNVDAQYILVCYVRWQTICLVFALFWTPASLKSNKWIEIVSNVFTCECLCTPNTTTVLSIIMTVIMLVLGLIDHWLDCEIVWCPLTISNHPESLWIYQELFQYFKNNLQIR